MELAHGTVEECVNVERRFGLTVWTRWKSGQEERAVVKSDDVEAPSH